MAALFFGFLVVRTRHERASALVVGQQHAMCELWQVGGAAVWQRSNVGTLHHRLDCFARKFLWLLLAT